MGLDDKIYDSLQERKTAELESKNVLLEQTVKQTVNVIMVNKKSFSPSIIGTFEDNSAGNIFAEELFIKIVRANHESSILEDEIEPLLDDGYYENDRVQIALSHSFNEFDNSSII